MNYLREVFASRELLFNLTLREVKGKYKRTVFGQLWSLVNPLVLMLIYTFIFSFIFRISPAPGDPSGLDVFALWLLCGLLPFTFLSNVINQAMGSIVDNAGLILKVSFSRIVLPLSYVASAGYNWLFEMAVLLVALAIVGSFIWPFIPLLVVIMLLLAMFGAGVALMLAIANVHFRDTQYFVTLLLQMWMYLSPIIYPVSLVQEQSDRVGGLLGTEITLSNLYHLNPLLHFVGVIRNLIYDNRLPDMGQWMVCLAWAVIALVVGVWVFRRNERKLAEFL